MRTNLLWLARRMAIGSAAGVVVIGLTIPTVMAQTPDRESTSARSQTEQTDDAESTAQNESTVETRNARQSARDARQTAREGTRETRESARDTNRDTREAARDTRREARQTARDTGREAREETRDTVRDLRDFAADRDDDSRDTRREIRQSGRDTARDARGRARDTARDSRDASDSRRDFRSDVRDFARDTAREAADYGRRTAREAIDTARDSTERDRDARGQWDDFGRDTARQWRDFGEDTARDARDFSRDEQRVDRDWRDEERDADRQRDSLRDSRDRVTRDSFRDRDERDDRQSFARESGRDFRDERDIRDSRDFQRTGDSLPRDDRDTRFTDSRIRGSRGTRLSRSQIDNFRASSIGASDLGLSLSRSSRGLFVDDIESSAIASTIGLRPGDRIVSVEDYRIANEDQFVRYLFDEEWRYDRVALTVLRNGRELPLYVRPAQLIEELVYVEDDHNPLETFGVVFDDRYDDYVVVRRVWRDTPAYQAGLRAGDVVTRFYGQPISTPREFVRVLNRVDVEQVPIEIERDRRVREFQVNVPIGQLRTSGRTRTTFRRDFDDTRIENRGAVLPGQPGVRTGIRGPVFDQGTISQPPGVIVQPGQPAPAVVQPIQPAPAPTRFEDGRQNRPGLLPRLFDR